MTIQEETIQRVLDDFPFDKVHDYMKSTNWEWAWHGIPTIEDLTTTATDLLRRACLSKEPSTLAATGGFRVYKFTWSGGQVELCLDFVPFHISAIFREAVKPNETL